MTIVLAAIIFLLTIATIVSMHSVLRAGRALDAEIKRVFDAEIERVIDEGDTR